MSFRPAVFDYRLPKMEQITKIALVLSLIGACIGFRRPDESEASDLLTRWLLAWSFSFCAAGCALWVARNKRGRVDRFGAAGALTLALAAAWLPIVAHSDSYHDYPWIVVVPLVLCGVVGAHLCGLRTVALATSVFLSAWLYPALRPPAGGPPAVRRVGRLECVLLPRAPAEPHRFEFLILDVDGADVGNKVETDHIEIVGKVGALEFVPLGYAHPLRSATGDKGASMEFTADCPAPWWTRTMDLEIILPRIQRARRGNEYKGPIGFATTFHFDRVPAH